MPWRVTCIVNERMRFVTRYEDGERMTDLAREFGISRKTGYKWKERFFALGVSGLSDRSRRPKGSPSEIGEATVCRIVKLKLAHPAWGTGEDPAGVGAASHAGTRSTWSVSGEGGSRRRG